MTLPTPSSRVWCVYVGTWPSKTQTETDPPPWMRVPCGKRHPREAVRPRQCLGAQIIMVGQKLDSKFLDKLHRRRSQTEKLSTNGFKASTTKIHWLFGAKTIGFLYAVQLFDKTFHVLNRLVSTSTPHVRPWEKTRLGSNSACFVLQFESTVKEPALLADGFGQMPRVYNLARGVCRCPFRPVRSLQKFELPFLCGLRWLECITNIVEMVIENSHFPPNKLPYAFHKPLQYGVRIVAQNTRATCRRVRYAAWAPQKKYGCKKAEYRRCLQWS